MTQRSILRFVVTLGMGCLCGWILGSLVDITLVKVSHDYIYPSGMFRQQLTLAGVVLACCVSIIEDWWRCEHLPWREWGRVWFTVVLVPAVAGATALLFGLGAKWGLVDVATQVPPARYAFCSGLVNGLWLGTFAALITFGLLRWRQWRKFGELKATRLTPPLVTSDSGDSAHTSEVSSGQ
ncbi:MAG: hypothetical protein KDA88_15685 [Planctomycetaceae bacterium]|nr:hypothetical protein [Planctomycetaceae bacterium]MCB9952051.1 hypothetical protein [Planctomycetaceae bacterium]